MGVGGTVPLSSSSSSETTGSIAKKRWVTMLGYCGNVLGYTLPYVVVLVLAGFHSDYPLMWRVALAFGAVPAVAVLHLNMTKTESASYLRQQERMKQEATDSTAEILACLRQPKYWLKLAGTGGPWFLQNIPVLGPKKILCIAPVLCGAFCTIMGILCTYHPDQTTMIFPTFCAMYSSLLFGFGGCN